MTNPLQFLIWLTEAGALEEKGNEEEVLHSYCGRVGALYLLAEARTTSATKVHHFKLNYSN